MSLDQTTRERIESLITSDRVFLFMKGNRQMPMCGFSAQTIGVLDSLVSDYKTFNVLEDQEIREGIKDFSSWPTIPQLYIDGEFVGGCDIVKQMFNNGDLHQALGLEQPDRTPPQITISDSAGDIIRDAMKSQPNQAVHLNINNQWEHDFMLGPVEGSEIKSQANGLEILMDIATAQKAKGLGIDAPETLQGRNFTVSNPNMPLTN
jgi:monothiol glutaredoxin